VEDGLDVVVASVIMQTLAESPLPRPQSTT